MRKWTRIFWITVAISLIFWGSGCINVKVQKYYYPDPNKPGEYISQWTPRVDSGAGATLKWWPEEEKKPDEPESKVSPEKEEQLAAVYVPPKTTKTGSVGSSCHKPVITTPCVVVGGCVIVGQNKTPEEVFDFSFKKNLLPGGWGQADFEKHFRNKGFLKKYTGHCECRGEWYFEAGDTICFPQK